MNLAPLLLLANLATQAVIARQALPVTPRDLPAGTEVAAAPTAEPMYLTLSLVLRDHAGLEALLAAQQDPASPQYHHFLTPEEFGRRFGWGPQYDALLRSLGESGLKVTAFPNKLFVRTTGTVGQYQKLLGVKMYDAKHAGVRFVTFQGKPSLAGGFAGMVQAVGGLDTRFRPRALVTDSQGNTTFGPDDLRAFYDMNAIHQQGITGTHAKAAMLGTYPDPSVAYSKSDINSFYTQYAHATTQLVEDKVTPASSNDYDNQQGLNVEETMDAELPVVAAPGLSTETMILVGASELFTTGIQHAVNSHPEIQTLSVSFGGCEQDAQQSDAQAADDAFSQGAAEGQTWFLASGDDGVTGCARSGGSTAASSSFPSDSPHVISVGGTMFTGSFDSQGSVTSYSGEAAWNESMQGQTAAGGGGYSVFFPHPSWQTGPGTISSHGREQPDLALMANVQPGIAINISSYGGFVGMGDGTSAAAPLAAGIFALVADQGSGCKLGLLNPSLYRLGATQASGGTAVFHDITQGNISANGTQGPSAAPGYDEATGWGSLDVTKLVNAFSQCSVVGGSTTGGTTSSGGTTTGGTTTGGTTTGGTTSGSTTGSTGGATKECKSCQQDSDCGPGGLCLADGSGGSCSVPCGSNNTCSDPNSTCVSITDQNNNPVGSGCFPSAQTCSGWTPGGSGTSSSSGGTTTGSSSGGTTTGSTSGATSSGGTTTGSSNGGTSGGGTTTGSSSGGATSGSTGAPTLANECRACSKDADCGSGAFCLGGACTAPCGENGTCADPGSTCYPLADANNHPLGSGCFPTSQSCAGFGGQTSTGGTTTGSSGGTPGTTGSSGATTAGGTTAGTGGGKSGGCDAAGGGDLAFALLGLLPLLRRRRR